MKIDIYIYITKELYRSMKDCNRELWKSLLVYNHVRGAWQLKKYLRGADVDIFEILDKIGANYKELYFRNFEYIYI